VKTDNPEFTFGQICSRLGEMWKATSEEDRVKYVELASADKERYNNEMKLWKENPNNKKARKSKDPNRPKRNLTAFLFYSNMNRDAIKASNPEAKFGEIGKILGQQWKGMTVKEKAKYNKLAEEDKARYQKDFEAYTSANAVAEPTSEASSSP
jgi:thymidylate synthase